MKEVLNSKELYNLIIERLKFGLTFHENEDMQYIDNDCELVWAIKGELTYHFILKDKTIIQAVNGGVKI